MNELNHNYIIIATLIKSVMEEELNGNRSLYLMAS